MRNNKIQLNRNTTKCNQIANDNTIKMINYMCVLRDVKKNRPTSKLCWKPCFRTLTGHY